MTNPDREAILERVASWKARLNVHPRRVRVQRMTRKWGSCSTAGTVTFAADLAKQDSGFQDFVVAHELLHLRLPNHGPLFKATLAAHVPDWKTHELGRVSPGRLRSRASRGARGFRTDPG